MRSRRFAFWQKVVAVAPLLLVAVVLPGEIMVRCHVDGLLRPAPCCAHEGEPVDASPAFKARDCCDRELSATYRPLSEAVPAAPDDQIAAAAYAPRAVAIAPVPSPPDHASWAAQRYGPAREGPAILLIKHAFLI